jgi:hypothetical protein
MSGHKITICGVHPPMPYERKMLEDYGVDVSDLGLINSALSLVAYGTVTADEIAMVVWGEDLARVPLIVYGLDGEVIYRDEVLTEDGYREYDKTARALNRCMQAEMENVV